MCSDCGCRITCLTALIRPTVYNPVYLFYSQQAPDSVNMNYLAIKHLHTTAATLSILFFIIRAYWSVTGSGLLQRRVVKITPHIVDTVLLVCGVTLSVMLGAAGMQPWVLTKMVLLVVYIGVGTIAIKRGKTAKTRGVAAIIAIAIFFYIVGIALNKSPASWFV